MPVSMTTAAATVAIAATAATQTVPVTSVQPIIENRVITVQEQHCTDVVRHYDNGDRAVIGGVIGGIIGSQIGNDHNTRRIMTGVGAIIGSQVGSEHNTNPSVHYRTQCAPSYSQKAVPTVIAYRVTYVVDGVMQSSVLGYNPGSHITIQRNYSIR